MTKVVFFGGNRDARGSQSSDTGSLAAKRDDVILVAVSPEHGTGTVGCMKHRSKLVAIGQPAAQVDAASESSKRE